jgi:hypothetical protein
MQSEQETLNFTLKDWKKGFYWGLREINQTIGYNQEKTIEDLDAFDIIGILNLVATDEYAPSLFFEDGAPLYEDKKLSLNMPELDENEEYPMIRLNLKTLEMENAPSNAAGVLFEDPLLALCAAKALSYDLDVLRGLIASPDAKTLFALRPKLLTLLQKRFFDGTPFFIEGEEYIGDFDLPSFDIVFVDGKDIINLRKEGSASCFINDELLFAEMYAN